MKEQIVSITPMNTIGISDDTRNIVKTILDKHGKDATVNFIKDLSGLDDNQADGFITLMTI